jgi:hypothetical protein
MGLRVMIQWCIQYHPINFYVKDYAHPSAPPRRMSGERFMMVGALNGTHTRFNSLEEAERSLNDLLSASLKMTRGEFNILMERSE